LSYDIFERVETELKYEGYIRREKAEIAENIRLEGVRLPEDIDYSAIAGISLEAAEKLQKVRPISIGQAGRISGISPADISVLIIFLEKTRREKEQKNEQ
ncbi:MAG: tRNA uridine-5-carboxymethylaminomethyl(34) synthesis enzyme MnmG, partial [Acutalibacteraceae bacterium]